MENNTSLENFMKSLPAEEVPEELKKEVFNSLDSIELVANIFDLFTAKFAKVETDFIDNVTGEKK